MTNSFNRARAAWQWCLAAAFRTGLACTIVGCVTLYGAASFHHQIAFPAFSYVTVILILTDATLGDAIHGCWLALYATVQSLGPAMLSLWLIGPAKFSTATVSLAVALAAFVVALPEGSHLIAKRIALGQIIIIYVIAFIDGVKTEPVMHPLHVAASTFIGALACVLALLLPYPRLASWEVKQKSKVLGENVSERLKLYLKALCAEDRKVASSSVSQAKLLAIAGTKLLQTINRYQESMKWERLPLKSLWSYSRNPGERLQELEIPLRGMEMALTDETVSFPVRMDGECRKSLVQLQEHVDLKLKQVNKNGLTCDSLIVPDKALQTIPTNHQDMLSLFFLFCLKLLHFKSMAKPTNSKQENEGSGTTSCKQESFFRSVSKSLTMNVRTKRLMQAFKCSLSLGFAVLFGLIYSKENGYWSGLPVALSLASAREATFKVANAKAQGTVLGTVYGVFGCFLFERFLPVRFLSLLPWLIFTNFLRCSQMYGQAGGISAAIGAVLILGRKNFGPPSEFAIARITETFIGLSCSIMIELVFQHKSASSLAKTQLSKSFQALHDCIGSIRLGPNKPNLVQKLKIEVNELNKLIGQAEVEPNFWFLPFNGACFYKLFGSLSKMVDLFLLSANAVGFLEQEYKKLGDSSLKDYLNKLDGDLQLYKEMFGSLIKCFKDVTLLKSLTFLEKELETKNISCDLELGKSSLNPNIFRLLGSDNDDPMENVINSYLQHSKEVVEKLHELEEKKEVKSQMVLSLTALGFCMSKLVKEAREIEKGINELVEWENPSNTLNLYEISCKIKTLYS